MLILLPGFVVFVFTKFQRDLSTFTSSEIWSWFWAALKVDRAILSYLVSYYYNVRSNDVKVLKSRWNFVKTNTMTRGNNIYTLLITFIAFSSFILSKFQTLYFPYKLSFYAWATCGRIYSQDPTLLVNKIYWSRWITPSEICLIFHILRKPNSLIVLLFIQNNS